MSSPRCSEPDCGYEAAIDGKCATHALTALLRSAGAVPYLHESHCDLWKPGGCTTGHRCTCKYAVHE